jgi:hypothetical protein
MTRHAIAFISLLVTAPLFAQQLPEPVELLLHPAKAPPRSLQHRLLPDPRELTPGNAATLYQRSLAMLFENEALLKELKKEQWSKWASTPEAEWPKDEVGGKLLMAKYLIREVDLAARCKECDWQIANRPEGIGLLIPDVQAFRAVGMVVAVKARQQIFTGDYAGASHTLQTGFALARHVASGPTLIQVLVGAAIAHNMLKQVEAWVQRPDAPSLYWPIAVLPRPFLDPLPALIEDAHAVDTMLPWFKQLDGGAWTEQQVAAAQTATEKMMDDFALRKPEPEEIAGRALIEAATYEQAMKALPEQGLTEARLKAMPSFQVTALFSVRECKSAAEELLKWAHLPEHFDHPAYKKAAEQYNIAFFRLDRLYFRGLLRALADGAGGYAPAFAKVYTATARVERRLAMLRTIEAIRLEGKLPSKLADVTVLPVPNDPATGKPFDYSAQKDSMRLHASPPPGEEATAANSWTYVLRMK